MECARQQAPGLVPSGQRPDQLGVRDDSATGRAERIVHQALQHDGHVLLSAESTNDMTKASKPSQLRCVCSTASTDCRQLSLSVPWLSCCSAECCCWLDSTGVDAETPAAGADKLGTRPCCVRRAACHC